MKKLLFLLSAVCLNNSCFALESPVGSWKRISSITVDAAGKKSDMQSSMLKAMPCVATMVYIFSSDGKMQTKAEACPDPIKKVVKKPDAVSRWKQTGNQVKITSTDNSQPPQNFQVAYKGDKMTWTFIDADTVKAIKSSKANSTIIQYQRL